MANETWLIAVDGRQLDGGHTVEQVREIVSREAGREVLVWTDSMQGWADPATLRQFKAAGPPPVPDPAPRRDPPRLPSPAPPAAAGGPPVQPVEAQAGTPSARHNETAPAVQLWNPNAAANWSLLLTPAFGAFLHAANWRALGRPDRAAANTVWFWVTVVFLAINIGTLLVPDSKTLSDAMRLGGAALLFGWYFSQGRPHAKFVESSLGGRYQRKSWATPLLAGFASTGAYIALAFFLAVATFRPNPNELADAVRVLILQEWQKEPELRSVKIQGVTLVHKGGNTYSGFVDAIADGEAERLKLEVTHDGQSVMWQLSQ